MWSLLKATTRNTSSDFVHLSTHGSVCSRRASCETSALHRWRAAPSARQGGRRSARQTIFYFNLPSVKFASLQKEKQSQKNTINICLFVCCTHASFCPKYLQCCLFPEHIKNDKQYKHLPQKQLTLK